MYFPLSLCETQQERISNKKKIEKLRIIKFQNIEGTLYVYSTSLRTSYFRRKHRS